MSRLSLLISALLISDFCKVNVSEILFAGNTLYPFSLKIFIITFNTAPSPSRNDDNIKFIYFSISPSVLYVSRFGLVTFPIKIISFTLNLFNKFKIFLTQKFQNCRIYFF